MTKNGKNALRPARRLCVWRIERMGDKSLEFVKKRIASGVCNGMENDKYEHMNEIDFTTIASKIQFNELVEVSENLWKTKLLFENGKTTEVSVKHNPNAQFDYFSTERCICDGTLLFAVELCKKIFNKILTGQSCYTPKMPKDAGEKPYNYDISFEIGNFVFTEEYGEQFATEDKPWMKSRFTVMLPIKCDFVEK